MMADLTEISNLSPALEVVSAEISRSSSAMVSDSADSLVNCRLRDCDSSSVSGNEPTGSSGRSNNDTRRDLLGLEFSSRVGLSGFRAESLSVSPSRSDAAVGISSTNCESGASCAIALPRLMANN